jgi:anti-anti-sigma factor
MDNRGRVSTPDGPVRGAGSAPARDRWRFVPMAGWIRSYERRWLKGDLNQESAAQGIANAGAGLFQGMPVSTSLSASSLNDHAGARTGLASLTSGVTVLLTLVVLAPVFSKLPKPALEDRVREVSLSTPGITGIVLDCEGIDFIDSQGSAKMREILELTDRAGMTLRLARVKPAVREVLERDGVLERIGDDKTHGNVDQAVEAQIHAAGGSRADI